jgi:4-amino-4-deoxy-L-arabinose transferase-like glycosyltransferase
MPKSIFFSSATSAVSETSPGWGAIALIALSWFTMVTLTNPLGDFPLNDDWAYAASVRELLQTGRLIIHDWSAPNVISQILWGAIFATIFGSSYTSLRFSTLVLGLLALIVVYRLIKELGHSSLFAIMVAMTTAGNPIFFASSNTFMTDVPFFGFSSFALFYYLRALNKDGWKEIGIGTIFAGLALLVRQLGFAIPLAFSFSYLVRERLTFANLFKAALPLIVCVLIQIIIQVWLHPTEQNPTHLIFEVFSQPVLSILWIYTQNIICVLLYVGLFASPVIILVSTCGPFNINTKQLLIIALISAFVWLGLHFSQIGEWPPLWNTLNRFGIGPGLQHGSAGFTVPTQFLKIWDIAGVVAVFCGCMLIYVISRALNLLLHSMRVGNKTTIRSPVFIGLTTLIYLLPVIALPEMYDRYLLLSFLTIPLFILSINEVRLSDDMQFGVAGISAWLLIISLCLVSVAMVHDYLSWNRSRWQALDDLMNKNSVNPNKIDGGFEFNGTFLYSKKWTASDRKIKKGWWVASNEYLISYSKDQLTNLEGYSVKAEYPVSAWLSLGPQRIFILHRE